MDIMTTSQLDLQANRKGELEQALAWALEPKGSTFDNPRPAPILGTGQQVKIITTIRASTSTPAFALVVWSLATVRCPRCGQKELPRRRPCPVVLDESFGETLVTLDQQHGCGEWWGPQWAGEVLDGSAPAGMAELLSRLAAEC